MSVQEFKGIVLGISAPIYQQDGTSIIYILINGRYAGISSKNSTVFGMACLTERGDNVEVTFTFDNITSFKNKTIANNALYGAKG